MIHALSQLVVQKFIFLSEKAQSLVLVQNNFAEYNG